MRILTVCTDGDSSISQHAQWSGYSNVAGIAHKQLATDVEVFLRSVAAKPPNPVESVEPAKSANPTNSTLAVEQTKEEKLKNLKAEIDRLLEEITLLENYT